MEIQKFPGIPNGNSESRESWEFPGIPEWEFPVAQPFLIRLSL